MQAAVAVIFPYASGRILTERFLWCRKFQRNFLYHKKRGIAYWLYLIVSYCAHIKLFVFVSDNVILPRKIVRIQCTSSLKIPAPFCNYVQIILVTPLSLLRLLTFYNQSGLSSLLYFVLISPIHVIMKLIYDKQKQLILNGNSDLEKKHVNCTKKAV